MSGVHVFETIGFLHHALEQKHEGHRLKGVCGSNQHSELKRFARLGLPQATMTRIPREVNFCDNWFTES